MDSLNIERQGLLLELVRNLTQNNIPGYNDKIIYKRAKRYQELFKRFYENQKEFSYNNQVELSNLHNYFYGTEFNFSNPDETEIIISSNVLDEFKKTFQKIKDLAEIDSKLSEQLSKSLNEIIGSIGYSKSEKQMSDYLALVNAKLQGLKVPGLKSEDFKSIAPLVKSKFEEIKETYDISIKDDKGKIAQVSPISTSILSDKTSGLATAVATAAPEKEDLKRKVDNFIHQHNSTKGLEGKEKFITSEMKEGIKLCMENDNKLTFQDVTDKFLKIKNDKTLTDEQKKAKYRSGEICGIKITSIPSKQQPKYYKMSSLLTGLAQETTEKGKKRYEELEKQRKIKEEENEKRRQKEFDLKTIDILGKLEGVVISSDIKKETSEHIIQAIQQKDLADLLIKNYHILQYYFQLSQYYDKNDEYGFMINSLIDTIIYEINYNNNQSFNIQRLDLPLSDHKENNKKILETNKNLIKQLLLFSLNYMYLNPIENNLFKEIKDLDKEINERNKNFYLLLQIYDFIKKNKFYSKFIKFDENKFDEIIDHISDLLSEQPEILDKFLNFYIKNMELIAVKIKEFIIQQEQKSLKGGAGSENQDELSQLFEYLKKHLKNFSQILIKFKKEDDHKEISKLLLTFETSTSDLIKDDKKDKSLYDKFIANFMRIIYKTTIKDETQIQQSLDNISPHILLSVVEPQKEEEEEKPKGKLLSDYKFFKLLKEIIFFESDNLKFNDFINQDPLNQKFIDFYNQKYKELLSDYFNRNQINKKTKKDKLLEILIKLLKDNLLTEKIDKYTIDTDTYSSFHTIILTLTDTSNYQFSLNSFLKAINKIFKENEEDKKNNFLSIYLYKFGYDTTDKELRSLIIDELIKIKEFKKVIVLKLKSGEKDLNIQRYIAIILAKYFNKDFNPDIDDIYSFLMEIIEENDKLPLNNEKKIVGFKKIKLEKIAQDLKKDLSSISLIILPILNYYNEYLKDTGLSNLDSLIEQSNLIRSEFGIDEDFNIFKEKERFLSLILKKGYFNIKDKTDFKDLLIELLKFLDKTFDKEDNVEELYKLLFSRKEEVIIKGEKKKLLDSEKFKLLKEIFDKTNHFKDIKEPGKITRETKKAYNEIVKINKSKFISFFQRITEKTTKEDIKKKLIEILRKLLEKIEKYELDENSFILLNDIIFNLTLDNDDDNDLIDALNLIFNNDLTKILKFFENYFLIYSSLNIQSDKYEKYIKNTIEKYYTKLNQIPIKDTPSYLIFIKDFVKSRYEKLKSIKIKSKYKEQFIKFLQKINEKLSKKDQILIEDVKETKIDKNSDLLLTILKTYNDLKEFSETVELDHYDELLKFMLNLREITKENLRKAIETPNKELSKEINRFENKSKEEKPAVKCVGPSCFTGITSAIGKLMSKKGLLDSEKFKLLKQISDNTNNFKDIKKTKEDYKKILENNKSKFISFFQKITEKTTKEDIKKNLIEILRKLLEKIGKYELDENSFILLNDIIFNLTLDNDDDNDLIDALNLIFNNDLTKILKFFENYFLIYSRLNIQSDKYEKYIENTIEKYYTKLNQKSIKDTPSYLTFFKDFVKSRYEKLKSIKIKSKYKEQFIKFLQKINEKLPKQDQILIEDVKETKINKNSDLLLSILKTYNDLKEFSETVELDHYDELLKFMLNLREITKENLRKAIENPNEELSKEINRFENKSKEEKPAVKCVGPSCFTGITSAIGKLMSKKEKEKEQPKIDKNNIELLISILKSYNNFKFIGNISNDLGHFVDLIRFILGIPDNIQQELFATDGYISVSKLCEFFIKFLNNIYHSDKTKDKSKLDKKKFGPLLDSDDNLKDLILQIVIYINNSDKNLKKSYNNDELIKIINMGSIAAAGLVSGGTRIENTFLLRDVFKLFYNFIGNQEIENSDITIYKLYFMLNIYSYYNDDQTLIQTLKEIIEKGDYSEEIIKIIEDIISKILNGTKKIFKDYISMFNEDDNIIKYYYLDDILLIRYLHINFIYKFYKNLELGDINLKLEINGTKFDINKSHIEILKEIEELINKDDFLFKTEEITIRRTKDLNEDIKYLIRFIYEFTSKGEDEIIIDNMSDLNAFIVMEMLSSETTIKLRINDIIFEIPNIKNKPYKFQSDNDKPLKVKIRLNEKQLELYDEIFKPENFRHLFTILKRDYYFIDFKITKDYKYKFYLNSEIMNLLEKEISFKKALINYNYYEYESEDLHFISILKHENIFITHLNYILYIIGSLFSKINIYNFKTLIYLYLIIKENSKDYLYIRNYDGIDETILKYKTFVNEVNIFNFIKEVLFYMRTQIPISSDNSNFIRSLINFKNRNPYIAKIENVNLNVDMDFIKNLFNNLYKDKDFKTDPNIDIYSNYYKSVNLILDIYNEILDIQLYNNCLIPIMKGLNEKGFDITDLENKLLNINVLLFKSQLGLNMIKGGKEEIEKSKEVIDKSKIVENLKIFLKFMKKFKTFSEEEQKYNIDKVVENYDKSIETNSKIKTDEGNSQDINQIKLPDPKSNEDQASFSAKMAKIKLQLDINKQTIDNLIKLYNEQKSREQLTLQELKDEFKEIKKSIIPFLKEFKDTKDPLVKANLKYLFVEDDKNKSLIEEIDNYLNNYEKIIEDYKEELKVLRKKYDYVDSNIKNLEDTFKIILQKPEVKIKPLKGGGEMKKGGNFKEKENIKEFKEKAKFKDPTKIDKFINNIKKLDASSGVIKNNKDNEEILNDFYSSSGDNLFERILYEYEKDAKENLPEIAKAKLYDSVEDNSLDPEIELEITFIDKLIFIVLIIVFRTIALELTKYFIEKDSIRSLTNSVIYYTVIYNLIFIISFIIINIDVFRLRLIFNYLNMHINSVGILIHVILNIIIGYIVYLLIINITPENKPSRLSKNQKLKLKFKLEMLTIAIMILLIIFILVV